MSRLSRACAVGIIAVVPFAAPSADAAQSKPVKKVLKDCADGKINKKHKVKALKKAKKNLGADVKQYSLCKPAVLNKAIKKAKKG